MAKVAAAPADGSGGFPGGEVPPVYLLYGEEEFLVEEALEAVLAAALPGAGRTFNLDVVGGAETDGREIVARASSFPMMEGRRVVVVREADRLPAHDSEILAAYVREPSPSSCLVLVAQKPDMRKKLFAAIKKSGNAREFKRLYENQVPSWITDHARKGGLRIEPEAAKLLAAYVGTSLREIAGELEKLSVFTGGGKEITAGDVAAVVGVSKEYTPFELQKAIGRRDAARAVTILEEMLNAGGAAPLIIATLTNYFLTLWKLHDLRKRGVPEHEQAAKIRVHPRFVGEYIDALGFHPPSACERALIDLAEADELSKSGTYGAREVLEGLIIRLCGGAGRNLAGAPGV